MKTTTTLLLSFCSILLTAAGAPEAPAAVLDISGKPLRVGTAYHILPVVRGRGGGLTLSATGNKTCPVDVVQDRFEVGNGLPLTFNPANAKKGVVRISTDHNIKFSASSTCAQFAVWKLDYDESMQRYFVTIGGVEGNPSSKTLSNWFKIERDDSDYKLVFCPTVCNFCKVVCRDFGVFVEGGVRRLSFNLTDSAAAPFKVMFKRAS